MARKTKKETGIREGSPSTWIQGLQLTVERGPKVLAVFPFAVAGVHSLHKTLLNIVRLAKPEDYQVEWNVKLRRTSTTVEEGVIQIVASSAVEAAKLAESQAEEGENLDSVEDIWTSIDDVEVTEAPWEVPDVTE